MGSPAIIRLYRYNVHSQSYWCSKGTATPCKRSRYSNRAVGNSNKQGHDKLMLCFLDAVGQQFANCKNHVIDSHELGRAVETDNTFQEWRSVVVIKSRTIVKCTSKRHLGH